ncbi:hypothetical protein J2Z21_003695 [Streptomyces griseochromogenes]|uniref:Uncharacterized protein n=1 Tax=Streptomyces griseochromogenes TaxID=68214 RepID=A0A1B1AP45_9ACTN|nr:hypothetical protein [Streptomyces griseochromogenes]ANP48316.1 hypothetical protein AVL59_00865 [Streptomyces griseochromogenes]MBP2050745.1 hypothetical protein [Streptomyces griseochromogenes]
MKRKQPEPIPGDLSEAFVSAADDAPRTPVPLAAIEREGRTRRRRRRIAALLTCCLLVLGPLGYVTWRLVGGAGSGSATPGKTVAAGAVRVVAAGERVRPLSGTELWLTKDGAHWSAPKGGGEFLPVAGLSSGTPAVTLRLEVVDGRLLLSGVHHGGGPAARVEVETPSGRVPGKVLTLAGDPGWDVWYATTRFVVAKDKRMLLDTRVTVYDANGKVLARGGVGS